MKKVIVGILAIIMACLGGVASGCASDENVLRVVTNAEFPPFESMDGTEFVGFDMDLIRAIGKELDMKVEITHIGFDVVVSSVTAGKYDVAIAGLTVSEDRAKQVNFSTKYFDASQYLIVKSDNTDFDGLTTIAEVEDKLKELGSSVKFGYQNGTTGDKYANGNEDWGFEGFKDAAFVGSASGNLAVKSLLAGNVNVVVIDEMPARTLVKANSGVKLIDVALTDEDYAIAVSKSNTELLARINAALEKLSEDGTIKKIMADHFGADEE